MQNRSGEAPFLTPALKPRQETLKPHWNHTETNLATISKEIQADTPANFQGIGNI